MVAFEQLLVAHVMPIWQRIDEQRLQLHGGLALTPAETSQFVNEWSESEGAKQFDSSVRTAIENALRSRATSIYQRTNDGKGDEDDEDEDEIIVLKSMTLGEIEDYIFARLIGERRTVSTVFAKKRRGKR